MGIKDLFEKPQQILSSADAESVTKDKVESQDYLDAIYRDKDEFVPYIDFASASNFAIYGSAEKYYEDAITTIHREYPYDGSAHEKKEYYLNLNYLTRHLLENEYPRTTGYVTLGKSATYSGLSGSYGSPATNEYIQIVGGPHTASVGMIDKPLWKTFEDSNKLAADPYTKAGLQKESDKRGTQLSNLRFNPKDGMTVEFWLKKTAFDAAKTKREVIFDLWNGIDYDAPGTKSTHGRLLIELTSSASDPIRLTMRSGSTDVFVDTSIASAEITSNTVASGKWNHYAIAIKSIGKTKTGVKLYVNGDLDKTTTVAGAINEVTGALKANIGALRYQTSLGGTEGDGLLSASLDDFRYWKEQRSSEQIGRYWWTNVDGGTNKEVYNSTLGVYYKFNEGISQTSAIDKVGLQQDKTILDYSGRVSNGKWVGYPGFESGARSQSSAIIESNVATSEYKEPIIYSTHPDVTALKSRLKASGSIWDDQNNSSLLNAMPTHIREQDENEGDGTLSNVLQIMGTYFDKLHHLIGALPHVRATSYLTASAKPYPFATHLLESMGMNAPQLFVQADVLESISARNEDKKFEKDINEVKNLVYQNIYNNLVYIYKTKGTEKSIRNLIRCFGVDEELIRLNMYATNMTYELADNTRIKTAKKKYINFNDVDKTDCTIYQAVDPNNSNTVGYITGSGPTALTASLGREELMGMTAEAEVIFPIKLQHQDPGYWSAEFTEVSLFGAHTPLSDQTLLTVSTPDYANFQVLAVKPQKNSPHAYFKLTSPDAPYAIPALTSSLFPDIYDNKRWNLSVRVKPLDPVADIPTGAEVSNRYEVHFYGVNMESGQVANSFHISSSLEAHKARNLIRSSKRMYAGAHRTNYTGDVRQYSDVKVSSVRYWATYLENSDLNAHARDAENYGISDPYRNAALNVKSLRGLHIPRIDTLALNWTFDNCTSASSDAADPTTSDSFFYVDDFSSGSLTAASTTKRYGWLSAIVDNQHSGKGDLFLPPESGDANPVDVNYISSARHQLPESLSSQDAVQILTQDDDKFTREHRIVEHYYAIEKSMYQTISEDMINMFASITDFNNLIGEPVNRYRQEYKDLSKLRQLYFEHIGNTPDLDRYINFYKWIDSAVTTIIQHLIPASAEVSEELHNMVESHVLERNKYWTKFPTIEFKQDDPEAGARGVVEMTYDWKHGHAPLYGSRKNESSSALWWRERAERTNALSSSSPGVNVDKEYVRARIGQHRDDSGSRLGKLDGTTYQARIYALKRFTKPYKFSVDMPKEYRSGVNFSRNKNLGIAKVETQPAARYTISSSINKPGMRFLPTNVLFVDGNGIATFKDVQDNDALIKTRIYDGTAVIAREQEFGQHNDSTWSETTLAKVLPGNVVKSSVITGYNKVWNGVDSLGMMTGTALTNIHHDFYGQDREIPIQGPFTEKYVGGHQSRHVRLNPGSDSFKNRPEAWRVLVGKRSSHDSFKDPNDLNGAFGFVGQDYPHPKVGREPQPAAGHYTVDTSETAIGDLAWYDTFKDGDTITISDGKETITFEWDADGYSAPDQPSTNTRILLHNKHQGKIHNAVAADANGYNLKALKEAIEASALEIECTLTGTPTQEHIITFKNVRYGHESAKGRATKGSLGNVDITGSSFVRYPVNRHKLVFPARNPKNLVFGGYSAIYRPGMAFLTSSAIAGAFNQSKWYISTWMSASQANLTSVSNDPNGYITNQRQAILSAGGGGECRISLYNNKLLVQIASDAGGANLEWMTDEEVWTTTGWHHLVVGYEAGYYDDVVRMNSGTHNIPKVYVDGVGPLTGSYTGPNGGAIPTKKNAKLTVQTVGVGITVSSSQNPSLSQQGIMGTVFSFEGGSNDFQSASLPAGYGVASMAIYNARINDAKAATLYNATGSLSKKIMHGPRNLKADNVTMVASDYQAEFNKTNPHDPWKGTYQFTGSDTENPAKLVAWWRFGDGFYNDVHQRDVFNTGYHNGADIGECGHFINQEFPTAPQEYLYIRDNYAKVGVSGSVLKYFSLERFDQPTRHYWSPNSKANKYDSNNYYALTNADYDWHFIGGGSYDRVDGYPPDHVVEGLSGGTDMLVENYHNPRATRYREDVVKRPVNIRNILQSTASADTVIAHAREHGPIGNYSHNYEIVQSAGRSINDLEFRKQDPTHDSVFPVEGEIALAQRRGLLQIPIDTENSNPTAGWFSNQYSDRNAADGAERPNVPGSPKAPLTDGGVVRTTSQAWSVQGDSRYWDNLAHLRDGDINLARHPLQKIKGSPDFPPARDFATHPHRSANKTVIVSRFSAPGGHESMSKAYLDPAHEEYSPYNVITFRNRRIRGEGQYVPTSGALSTDAEFKYPNHAVVGWTGYERKYNDGTRNLMQDLPRHRGFRVVDIHGEPWGLRTHLARHATKFGSDSVLSNQTKLNDDQTVDMQASHFFASYHKVHPNKRQRKRYTDYYSDLVTVTGVPSTKGIKINASGETDAGAEFLEINRFAIPGTDAGAGFYTGPTKAGSYLTGSWTIAMWLDFNGQSVNNKRSFFAAGMGSNEIAVSSGNERMPKMQFELDTNDKFRITAYSQSGTTIQGQWIVDTSGTLPTKGLKFLAVTYQNGTTSTGANYMPQIYIADAASGTGLVKHTIDTSVNKTTGSILPFANGEYWTVGAGRHKGGSNDLRAWVGTGSPSVPKSGPTFYETAIFATSCSLGQLSEIYGAGANGMPNLTSSTYVTAADHCLAWWRFGDAQGDPYPETSFTSASNAANMVSFNAAGTTLPNAASSYTNALQAHPGNDAFVASFAGYDFMLDNQMPATQLTIKHGKKEVEFHNDLKYDNWYVQHQIPRSEINYSWIQNSLDKSVTHKLWGFPTSSGEIDRYLVKESDIVSALAFGPSNAMYSDDDNSGAYWTAPSVRFYGATKIGIDTFGSATENSADTENTGSQWFPDGFSTSDTHVYGHMRSKNVLYNDMIGLNKNIVTTINLDTNTEGYTEQEYDRFRRIRKKWADATTPEFERKVHEHMLADDFSGILPSASAEGAEDDGLMRHGFNKTSEGPVTRGGIFNAYLNPAAIGSNPMHLATPRISNMGMDAASLDVTEDGSSGGAQATDNSGPGALKKWDFGTIAWNGSKNAPPTKYHGGSRDWLDDGAEGYPGGANRPTGDNHAGAGDGNEAGKEGFGELDGHAIAGARVLNGLLTHRMGPYGWPSWKQVRGGEHPIARLERKSNRMSYVLEDSDEIYLGTGFRGGRHIVIRPRFGETHHHTRITPVSSKYKPLASTVGISTKIRNSFGKEVQQVIPIDIATSYGNDLVYFNKDAVNNDLNLSKPSSPAYDEVKAMYTRGALETSLSPVTEIQKFTYTETVYPAHTNMYMGDIRVKKGYENKFWRGTHKHRVNQGVKTIHGLKQYGRRHGAYDWTAEAWQSCWPLDDETGSYSRTPEDFFASNIQDAQYVTRWAHADFKNNMVGMGEGELLNRYTYTLRSDGLLDNANCSPEAGPLFAMPHFLHATSSITHPTGAPLVGRDKTKGFGRWIQGIRTTVGYTLGGGSPASKSGTPSGSYDQKRGPGENWYFTVNPWRAMSNPDMDNGTSGYSDGYVGGNHSGPAGESTGAGWRGARPNVNTGSAGNWSLDAPSPQPFSMQPLDYRSNWAGFVPILGGHAKWQAGPLAGKVKEVQTTDASGDGLVQQLQFISQSSTPWYSNYSEFAHDIRVKAKDYSVLPEFRMEDHLKDYILKKGNNFLSEQSSLFRMVGMPSGSFGDNAANSSERDFYKVYATSDFMKHFDILKNDIDEHFEPSSLTLKCNAVIKFNPYDGFYPAQRTLQLASALSQSYGSHIRYTGTGMQRDNVNTDPPTDPMDPGSYDGVHGPEYSNAGSKLAFRNFLTPLFAPGIMYNTIKSGIACDWPVMTDGSKIYKTRAGKSDYWALGFPEPQADRELFAKWFKLTQYETSASYANMTMNKTINAMYRTKMRNIAPITTGPYAIREKLRKSVIKLALVPQSASVGGLSIGTRIQGAKSQGATNSQGESIKDSTGFMGYEPGFYMTKVNVQNLYIPGLAQTSASIHPRVNKNGLVTSIGITASIAPGENLGRWDMRIPFEAIVNPENYMKNLKLFDYTPYPSSSMNVTASWSGEGDSVYTLMTNNFLAAVPEVFLSDGKYTSIASRPQDELSLYAQGNRVYGMRLKMYRTLNRKRDYSNEPIWSYSSDFDGVGHKAWVGSVLPSSAGDDWDLKSHGISRLHHTASTLYDVPQDPLRDTGLHETFTMYSRSSGFGYPIFGRCHTVRHHAPASSGRNEGSDYDVWGIAHDYVKQFVTGTISPIHPQDLTALGETLADDLQSGMRMAHIYSNISGKSNYDTGGIQTMDRVLFHSASWQAGVSGALDSISGYNWSYTPPYYHGEAWCDLLFKPSVSKTYSLGEILDQLEMIQYRVDPGFMYPTGSTGEKRPQFIPNGYHSQSLYSAENINANAMQLDSCLNLFGLGKVKSFAYGNVGRTGKTNVSSTKRTLGDSPAWVIQPKFETPHLNFSPLRAKDGGTAPRPLTDDILELPKWGSGSVARGIWHQFGTIPQGNEGIWLEAGDIPANWLARHPNAISSSMYAAIDDDDSVPSLYKRSLLGDKTQSTHLNRIDYSMKSLVDLVGMDSTPKKLGEIRDTYTVSEAVVAVPFIESENKRYFFTIDPHMIDIVLGENSYRLSDGSDAPGRSIEKLVDQMDKYVFPPTFDFIRNRNVDAIAMYVFEFGMTFDRDDLSYIWQNLQPPSAEKFSMASSTVHHHLLINELMGYANKTSASPMKDRVQWLVFKVKQRAPTNYYDTVIKSSPELDKLDKTARSQQVSLGSNLEDKYSFNWPYDYFSIIEMAKIEASVEFSALPDNIPGAQRIDGSGGARGKAGQYSGPNIPGQTVPGMVDQWRAGGRASADNASANVAESEAGQGQAAPYYAEVYPAEPQQPDAGAVLQSDGLTAADVLNQGYNQYDPDVGFNRNLQYQDPVAWGANVGGGYAGQIGNQTQNPVGNYAGTIVGQAGSGPIFDTGASAQDLAGAAGALSAGAAGALAQNQTNYGQSSANTVTNIAMNMGGTSNLAQNAANNINNTTQLNNLAGAAGAMSNLISQGIVMLF